jgi:hypothetical protein
MPGQIGHFEIPADDTAKGREYPEDVPDIGHANSSPIRALSAAPAWTG